MKRKYGQWMKVPNDFDEEMIRVLIRQHLPPYYTKGWVNTNCKLRIGQENNDFINNMITCVITWMQTKAPRIVQKTLAKRNISLMPKINLPE